MAEKWRLTGQVLVACNCDWGCPCNFNARPTTGKCEGGWTWHVEQGTHGDVALNGLNLSVYANWPGAIHEGNGEALLLIDERANDAQRRAIESIMQGKTGGPWETLGWTWPRAHGPFYVSYDLTLDGINTKLKAGHYVHVECGPIRNPVSGAESHPGVLLPEGIILKQGDLGATRRFTVSNGVHYDHSGKYMAVGPFDYAWAPK